MNVILLNFIQQLLRKAALPGDIKIRAGGLISAGWLECDGTSYPVAAYPSLFNEIGYAWGGAGANFNVPDFRGVVPRGRVGVVDRTILPADVNVGLNTITVLAHEYNHTGFAVHITTTGTLPNPLVTQTLEGGDQPLATTYYVIVIDGNTIKLASSHANALAGSPIILTTSGIGVHTLSQWLDPAAAGREAMSPGGASGDTIGSYQDDQVGTHGHSFGYATSGGGTLSPGANATGRNTGNPVYGKYGDETRVKNANVMFLIKT